MNIIFAVAIVLIFNCIPFNLSSYVPLFITAAITCIIVVPLQIVVNFLINRSAGIEILKMIKLKFKKKKEN